MNTLNLSQDDEKISKIWNSDMRWVSDQVNSILVIDDEIELLNLINAALTAFWYNVFLNDDWYKWLDFYKNNSKKIDLVLLDLVIWWASGIDILRELIKFDRRVKVIICSGEDWNLINKSDLEWSMWFLKKPFTIYELKDIVELVLKR